jgi:hypothetical protein
MKRKTSTRPNHAIRNLIGGLLAFGLAATALPLHAAELTPLTGESIDLGSFHGVLYYTSEEDGYRVVATIADGEDAIPVRFSATLAENQSATISIPGQSGKFSHCLKISRSGDKLILAEPGHVSAIAD